MVHAWLGAHGRAGVRLVPASCDRRLGGMRTCRADRHAHMRMTHGVRAWSVKCVVTPTAWRGGRRAQAAPERGRTREARHTQFSIIDLQ